MVLPSRLTSAAPPARLRSWVGMRTVTATSGLLEECWERGPERVERRWDRRCDAHVRLDGVERLEPVARDVRDDPFVPAHHAVGRELGQRRDRHAGGSLAEDAFGTGEQ